MPVASEAGGFPAATSLELLLLVAAAARPD